MFENYRTFKYELAGRPLVIETGKIAQLSNGSCLVRYGETVILANATASAAPRDGIDFLPLSVDYEERLYAVGKIPDQLDESGICAGDRLHMDITVEIIARPEQIQRLKQKLHRMVRAVDDTGA